jgi:uncharacterized membrane protein
LSAKPESPAAPALPTPRRVPVGAPLRWLALGWADLKGTGFAGTFYGAVFALMGLAIMTVYETRWQLTMGLTAGFFLVAPFVCCGIYWLSRQRARGERASLVESLGCWRRNPSGVGFYAAIVTFAMIVWARVSIVIFALFSTRDFPTLQGVLKVIFSLTNLPFVTVWFGVGLVFASLVFAISVVSVPMMLDRNSDTMMAIFTSVRALWANPVPAYLWAALIVIIVGASLLSGMVALVVTGPLVGHATWHAYDELVGNAGSAGTA